MLVNIPTLGTAQKPALLAACTTRIRCTKAVVKTSEAGNPMISFFCDVPSQPLAKSILHTFMLPVEGNSEKQINERVYDIQEALIGMGLDETNPSIETDLWVGRESAVEIIVKMDKGDGYGQQNKIKTFLAPDRAVSASPVGQGVPAASPPAPPANAMPGVPQ